MRIAVLGSGRWAEFRGSMHELARATAALGHETLYVDPPLSPLSIVRHPDRMADLCGPRHTQPEPDLAVWKPLVVPAQNSRLAQNINAQALRRGVRSTLGAPDASVCFTLEARGVLGALDGTRIYSCIDSLEDLPGVDAATIRHRERQLLAICDRVVACSLPLQRQLEARGTRADYVPHGCDPGFIRPDGPVALPCELVGRQRPFVGYVGSMNFRLDARLLWSSLRAVGDGTLVLVGGRWTSAGPPPSPEVEALLRSPRVVTVDHRDGEALKPYLWALDVGLVPYSLSAFNRKSFPIKVPQYLAAGAAVVSTPNGATEGLPGEISVAVDEEGFADAVRRAIEDRNPKAAGRRRALAAGRPWTQVAAETFGL